MVTPGAQSLVTAILTDSWAQARTAMSTLWARYRGVHAAAEPDSVAIERAGAELELAKNQAITLAGDGPEADRAIRLHLFWAGYLAGQLAARPELAEAVKALPALFGQEPGATPAAGVVNTKTVSGTVRGNVVQSDDVSGGIIMGR